jgi:hypothetical protein
VDPENLSEFAFLPLSYKMEQVVCACHPADGEKPLDEGRIEGDKMYAKTADEKI